MLENLKEHAVIIREMIKHENELINHRTTWLTTIQGFLFGALAFAWDKKDAAPLIFLLTALGALLSISAGLSLRTARSAIDKLTNWWEENSVGYEGPPVIGWPGDPHPKRILLFMRPWRFVPFAFTVSWVLVFLAYMLR